MFFGKYLKAIQTSFILLFVSSCAQNNSPTMTEQGVGAGAVIGAGVGAIVGASAGEAGAGAVLGSVAGATSGGVIGHSMEADTSSSNGNKGITSKSSSKSVKTVNNINLKSNSRRSQLSYNKQDKEGSFLGKYIWDRSKEEDQDNSSYSYNQVEEVDNLPSGSKGVAAKFAQIRPKSLESNTEIKRGGAIKSDDLGEEIKSPRARLTSSEIKTSPKIDLVKPKEVSELPKAATNTTLKAAKKEELPLAKASKVEQPLVTSKTQIPAAKKQVLTPSLPKVDSKKEEKLEKTKSQDQEEAKLASNDLPPAKKQEEAIKLEEPKEEVTTKANTTKTENNPSKCPKAENEIQRAKNSPSDSDKVFYLRRAILSCPQNASLKVELGKVYGRLGLKDDARREFNNALEADPSNATAEEELSIMMLEGSKK